MRACDHAKRVRNERGLKTSHNLPLHAMIIVRTINPMRIEFDAEKDVTNLAKHGLSLAFAERLDWDRMMVRPDDRHEYGETRWIGSAQVGRRLYVTVFTQRGSAVRIISLRKANRREITAYEKATQTD